MKLAKFIWVAAVALAALGAAATEPHAVKQCGFNATKAAADGVLRYILGQSLDCVLWACIPVFGPLGFGSAIVEQIDVDCAGAVHEALDGDGNYRYAISWDYDSLQGAREGAKSFCEAQGWGRCRELLVFRHAAAGYRPAIGKRAFWAQAADLPTARLIAHDRCERATRTSCSLVLERENRN